MCGLLPKQQNTSCSLILATLNKEEEEEKLSEATVSILYE
tara:strand:- start:522 stop:641 length:120 start_codon:yes stop_codon:yes gene_type:complete